MQGQAANGPDPPDVLNLPAVCVHGLEQACVVLRAATAPVLLLSAEGAAGYAGCGWWRALMTQAATAVPQARFADLLDCGDAPGYAMAALRIGQAALILQPHLAWERVHAAAARQGARVLRTRPPALDLAHHGAMRHLGDWLSG